MKKLFFTLLVITCSWSVYSQQTAANWQPLGPISFPNNISGIINGMGRVVQMKFDPVIPNRAYAVSVNSVWRTTDNAESWSVLPGLNSMPPSAIASVCIDNTNTDIIYIGTGDPNYYSATKASGVWKSTDGGITFVRFNTGMGNRLVLDIIISPLDHNTVVAATNNGIYKTTDGGANWVQQSAVTNITGFAKNPAPNSQVLYFSRGVAGSTGEFYRSTDFGTTWAQIALPAPAINLTYGGSRVSVTEANIDVVYLSFVGRGGGGPTATVTGGGIIYKSIDGGLTFTLQKGDGLPNITGYQANQGGQGNYNWSLGVSPNNDNTLISGSHVIWKSIDGGITWTQLQSSWTVKVHTDMHHIFWNPNNPNEIFNCNDGGVWKSTDLGNTWTPKCQNMISTEFYHFANSKFNPLLIGGGTQDNGELFFNGGIWNCNRSGDLTTFYYFDRNPALPGKAYYISAGTTRDLINQPVANPRSLGLSFTRSNSDQYAFSYQNNNVAYVKHNFTSGDATGAGGIYRTNDLQNLLGSPAWTKIYSYSDGTSNMAVETHPASPDTIYTVSRNKDVIRCDNALSAAPVFTVIKTGAGFPAALGLPSTATTLDLEVLKKDVLYMLVNGKVIRSADKGVTWTDYTGIASGSYVALPSTVNFNKLVHDSSQNNESIYVYSVNSVYYRNNTMQGWMLFINNLPATPNFTDLDIYNDPLNPANNRLRLSTYGRGLWETAPSVFTGALPLKLISFTGREKNNYNVLEWKTDNEINTKDFEILRSFDGRNFTLLGKVIAYGNSSTVKTYNFTDIDGITPNTTYYYRLKMNDIDGNNSYSNIIKLQSRSFNNQYVNIYPNPVDGNLLNLTVYSKTTQKATAQIFNTKGDLVSTTALSLINGSMKEMVSVDKLPAGSYILKLTMADGSILNKQFIKQ